MPPSTEQRSVVLHIKFDEQLWAELERFSRLERRPKAERARFLLEAIYLFVSQNPRFSFPRESLDPERSQGKLVKDFRLELPEEFNDRLFHLAGQYGMKISTLIRILLRTALFEKRRWAPDVRLISKEVFIELLLEHSLTHRRVH